MSTLCRGLALEEPSDRSPRQARGELVRRLERPTSLFDIALSDIALSDIALGSCIVSAAASGIRASDQAPKNRAFRATPREMNRPHLHGKQIHFTDLFGQSLA